MEKVIRRLECALLRIGTRGMSAGGVFVIELPVACATLHGIACHAPLMVMVGQRHRQQHQQRYDDCAVCGRLLFHAFLYFTPQR